MGIYVKFTKTTHQISSCHVSLASNSENFYFSPILYQILGKVTKVGGNWLKNKKLQAENKLGDGKHTPSAYRVKVKSNFRGLMHQSIPSANIPPGQPPGFCTYFHPGSPGFVPSGLPGGRTYY